MSRPKKDRKVHFWETASTIEAWDGLAFSAGFSSRAALIRRAVALYEVLWDAVDRGAKVVVVEKDGTTTEVRPTSL